MFDVISSDADYFHILSTEVLSLSFGIFILNLILIPIYVFNFLSLIAVKTFLVYKGKSAF